MTLYYTTILIYKFLILKLFKKIIYFYTRCTNCITVVSLCFVSTFTKSFSYSHIVSEENLFLNKLSGGFISQFSSSPRIAKVKVGIALDQILWLLVSTKPRKIEERNEFKTFIQVDVQRKLVEHRAKRLQKMIKELRRSTSETAGAV